MTELLSALIPLSPSAATDLPANLGRATHAWFMDRVRAHDHRLAERLHAPNQERPFTVSNLIGGRASENHAAAQMHVSPDQTCLLRVTSFEPTLTALLLHEILPNLSETVWLGGGHFRRAAVITTAEQAATTGQRLWVGQTTFAELTAACTLQSAIPPRITLRFASPTVFKSQDHFLPYPLPRLVFEGLTRRWNAFSPIQVHPDVNRYAEACMAITHYRLHTTTVRFGEDGARGIFPGFVGHCTYALRVKDRYWMGLIHLLAAFARYAGIGKETARGMGQARSVDAETPVETLG